MNAIVHSDFALHVIESEPRIQDIELGKRLGMARPRDIRKLIERNKVEIEGFGTCATVAHVVRGNPVMEYYLNEEQSLLVCTLSDAPLAKQVRAMLIRVFVEYRRGNIPVSSPASLPADLVEMLRRTDGISRMLSHKVTQIEQVVASIAAVVQPSHPILIRHGRTAGQILRAAGIPPMKGLAAWFGNRLQKFGCRVENNGCSEMGLTKARLFDPDRAEFYLASGGRVAVQQKIAERKGQKSLRLITD